MKQIRPAQLAAQRIIAAAHKALGNPLPGSKLDLLADSCDTTFEEFTLAELEGLLVDLDHRCGFCRKDKTPGVDCKHPHYVSPSTKGY